MIFDNRLFNTKHDDADDIILMPPAINTIKSGKFALIRADIFNMLLPQLKIQESTPPRYISLTQSYFSTDKVSKDLIAIWGSVMPF